MQNNNKIALKKVYELQTWLQFQGFMSIDVDYLFDNLFKIGKKYDHNIIDTLHKDTIYKISDILDQQKELKDFALKNYDYTDEDADNNLTYRRLEETVHSLETAITKYAFCEDCEPDNIEINGKEYTCYIDFDVDADTVLMDILYDVIEALDNE